jgi:hypothetical protein
VRGWVREDIFEESFETVESCEPGLHQMYILEHDPVTLLGAVVDCFFGDFFLSLSHGDVDESTVFGCDVKFFTRPFDLRGRIDSGEEDEEYRDLVGGLFKHLEDVKGRLFNVALAKFFHYEITHGGGESVGPHGSEKKEFVEFRDFLEGLGKVGDLGVGLSVPLLPLKDIGFEGLAEPGKGGDLFKFLDGRPDGFSEERSQTLGDGSGVQIHFTDD